MNFLRSTAERYAGKPDLGRLCFVFPNRRSATFFKRYLGIAAGRPVFVPNILTIDRLFSRISGMEETQEKARLLYLLYREYARLMQEAGGKEVESFDRFIHWGDILLSDFDDLDKYLVDVDRLLLNLRDLKEMTSGYDFLNEEQKAAIASFCNSFFAGTDIGELPEGTRRSFAEIWNQMLPLYKSFRRALAAEGCAYAGMIYRSVAESLAPGRHILPCFDEFIFIGLNVLNPCEKALLDHLRAEGRADFYWDFAGPMVTDPDNPSSRFISENIRRYPTREAFDCPARDPRTQYFEVVRVPSAVGQTRKAAQILRELQKNGVMADPEDTAVVLPDESLLFPMTGAIPEGIDKVNITMGYSLQASNGTLLFQLLERLQENCRQRNGQNVFYHRDVTGILEHPYFSASADTEVVKALAAEIRSESLVFVGENELVSKGGIFSVVFHRVSGTGDIPGYLLNLIEHMQAAQPPLEREFMLHFHKCVAELAKVGLPLESLEAGTWYRLLMQYVSIVKIPYEGEPLSGLQIMGPLETRAIDFRNIIILSVGEGVYPSRSVSSSFIPYNLRLGFGLPTYELQDSVRAYYFYRSICRAERIYLLYDSRTEGLQSGEESRFIKQLRYLYEVPLTEKVASFSLAGAEAGDPLCIHKDEMVMNRLKEIFIDGKKAFSASSLNSYIDCPLSFYFRYVEKIKEQDEVVEEVDAGLFGTIFHKLMEKLYKPLSGRLLKAGELQDEFLFGKNNSLLDTLVADAFAQNNIRDIVGQNLIIRELIVHFVKRTVEVDRLFASRNGLYMLSTEKNVDCQLALPACGRNVKLHGIIDRLDSCEKGVERVVDYKSGKVGNLGFAKVSELFDSSSGRKRSRISFQLLFYALLMNRRYPKPGVSYHPCVYSLRSIFTSVPEYFEIPREVLTEYESRLVSLIEEIFNPGIPFSPCPGNDDDSFNSVCTYCEFSKLCNRG